MDGRITGSGAIFSGTNDQELAQKAIDYARARGSKIADETKDDLSALVGRVAQDAVSSASPGAVIVTRQMMMIGVAIVAAFVLFNRKAPP